MEALYIQKFIAELQIIFQAIAIIEPERIFQHNTILPVSVLKQSLRL